MTRHWVSAVWWAVALPCSVAASQDLISSGAGRLAACSLSRSLSASVAAASVVARSEFLLELKDLGAEYGVELPKGAGLNVEAVGRRFFQDYGMEALRAVAKVHFKTTKRVTEELF